MKSTFRFYFPALVLISLFAIAGLSFLTNHFAEVSGQTADKTAFANREAAFRENNIGVAYLEQFSHKEAVEAFKRALKIEPKLKLAQINLAIALFNDADMDGSLKAAEAASEIAPDELQPPYLLGLIARNQNRIEDAVAKFERILTIDKFDVGTNVNLGQIYIQQRKYQEAIAFLRRALDAEPYNSTAMYNLATVLLRTDNREEGQQLMKAFQDLRSSGSATTIGQNYLEQGRYAEGIVSTGAESDLVDKAVPKIEFSQTDIGLPRTDSKENAAKQSGVEPFSNLPPQAATLTDFDNDGDLDAFIISKTASTISLYVNDKGKFTEKPDEDGDLNKPFGVKAFGMISGDIDNDNFADLLVFGEGQPALFRNNTKGGFENITASSKIPNSSVISISGAFLDADHDGDLDIFLGGFADGKKKSGEFSANILLRNNGDGTFLDISETARINLPSRAVAVIPTDFDNRRDVDVLVLNYGAKPNLFRNLRNGMFADVAAEVGLPASGNWTSAAAGDFNKDGFTDFFFGKASEKGIFAVSDGRGKFVLKEAPSGTENAAAAQFIDYDSDGLLDLIVNNEDGFRVVRNLGNAWDTSNSSAFKIDSKIAAGQILSGDIDADSDIDLLTFAQNGSLSVFSNQGGNLNKAEIIRLQGRVSNRNGIGAKIDLRSGSLTQKLESYSASPMPAPSAIHFGLGKREKPDAIRVIWPSGVVQAEIDFSAKSKTFAPFLIEELDRKPSSCPYLYTWNGEKFEFITDFLGGGEMGNWLEAGAYHYPDSNEFVRITSDQLKPKDGKYEIRVTNELEEVLFLDKLKLIAVEHDADSEVYPDEGLGIPTVGKQILYTTKNEKTPISAANSLGQDVLPKIEKIDRNFYSDFKNLKIRGYAEPHNLTLNLDDKIGFTGRTLLLLTGWTDYAFSSDNLSASQSGKSQFLPKLQVKNKLGEWETVIEKIGISVGRPQTLVVDLTGKFLSDSREVRIVTNFKTYWDKIAVDTSLPAEVKSIELKSSQADLTERGFSVESKINEMIVPDYQTVVNDGRWKYFSGNFTRIGDVKPLLNDVDDVFVVSKTGDELVLSFDALPEPKKGKKYTFLLFADGYSKEMDINSGSPHAVFPLPFKAMKKYPYSSDERFPMTDEKRRIYDEYTTRIVKGFLPRLETALISPTNLSLSKQVDRK